MAELRFDDRVVIVTGAGGGLGRAHALLFGARGAKVVVNDLGGGMHGGGQSQKAADAVVAEIQAAGGQAVANYDSVEDGEKIVETALDAYGRVDVVVNNAGILRDVSFHKMSQEDWDIIYRVHVYGSFKVTHAAWNHMRDQGYGRIIMTASAAGIYGNFGQANYSMAKLGLTGFANTLAIEGHKKNVHVNTIAPLAGSRLTETVLPKELTEALAPEYVSPLVAWLCHEDCQENGGLFEVGGGFFAKLRWERTAGKMMRLGRGISPEWVKQNFSTIAGFDKTTHPTSVAESLGPIMDNVQAGPSKGGNQFIDVDEALGYEFPEQHSSYDERDLALYALSVGAGADPMNQKDLRLVYEMHRDGFLSLPTFSVIPPLKIMMEFAQQGKTAPGLHYGLDRLLHGEQYTEVLRPLPKKAKLTHRAKIKEIWDKGKGAIINNEVKTYDEDGELLAVNNFISFIKGAGGWGGESGPSGDINNPPERAPDAVAEDKLSDNQALLYRLTGDWNPLHADPSFAKAFGFEKPILHGLCTFGFSARHVINAFADGDPRLFKSIKVRFAKSVYPGDTLVTEMWKESDTRIVFRTKVKERDEVVISNAAIELYTEIPKPRAKKPAAASAGAAAAPTQPTSADIFTAIGTFLGKNPDTVAKVGKVFQFKLTNPASVWTLDVKSSGAVTSGESQKPDCTLELTDKDFMDMCTGKADPQKLYFGGQLKISGDIMASQKLTFLKKLDPQMVVDAMKARAASGGAAEDAAAPASAESQSRLVFLGIKAYVAEHPELADKIKTVFLFKLADPDSAWTLDLKNEKGAVHAGEVGKADCTLEISDSDFLDMTSGKADAQKLYFGGKLKISGDVMASQKLTFLQKIDPEWAKQKVAEMLAAGDAPAAVAASSSSRQAVAPAVFDALGKRLAENPELAAELGARVQFTITEPDAVFTVDASSAGATVVAGAAEEPAAVITLADEDLESLVKREKSPQDLFQRGNMRVDGDVTVAHRLGCLNHLI